MKALPITVLFGGIFLLGCAGVGADTAENGGGGGGFLGLGDDTGSGEEEEDPAKTDSDGDGLTNAEEDDLGTDPDKADSDGDGFDDPDEVEGNTDPNKASDHPYEGGWPIGACRNDVQGEGFSERDISDNFNMEDQFGEEVELHAFCENVVYMVFAAVW
ncbi:hypothetical protein LBMAG42_16110 [Deltaproteobacteria bacterium]|nr:hypothetical protein LBMAG42_16110 [Deltaproteobacteria bacterium]